ncbi:MAG TPA: hypothetical protein VFX45_09125 [Solirubrobacterales bacterium]|nr:hypothetical protein [Solirubrobacterales bacterium]
MTGRLDLGFVRAGTESTVAVEVGLNDDPARYGCWEFAVGFPWCRATIAPPARGYADALGWVQLVEATDLFGEFRIDPFEPLGEVTHPFCFFGFSPTLFDAPHRDHRDDMDFLAHSFLCGLGPKPLDNPSEVDALLGFSWGFKIRDGRIEPYPLARLEADAWDAHHPYLTQTFPRWSFLPGFR